MPVTQRQITLVQTSFAKVEPIAEQAADIFYTKLFEYDPKLKPLFKSDIKAQGRKLMATLKVATAGLNDLNTLVPVLHQLAERHVNYGVKAADFTPVGNALLYALHQGLGDKFTDEVRQAWVEVFRLVATTMKDHSFS
ncbi:hemin receptor [Gammaproteobacteria bacterium 42_54_T18]|nr:hemin receptor [Gammaproteobacteria bacterium 42_54_T18]